jgi:hypothetical protein
MPVQISKDDVCVTLPLIFISCNPKRVSKAQSSDFLKNSFANPDPGSGAYLTPKSGMGKKSVSGSGMNNPDHISESLETIFWVKILKSIDADIRDGKNSDPV